MKKKIVFGITGLTLGGAERTLVDIANRLVYKYDITIFCIYSEGELEKQLDKRIQLIHLCKKSYNELTKIEKIYMSYKIITNRKYLYKTYIWRKFDKEIAFLEGPITRLFAADGKKSKKIVWIHNDITKVFGKGLKATIKKIIDKRTYKKFGQLVFVSKDNLKKFNKKYKIKNDKCVIYNYIEKDEVIRKSNSKINFEYPEDSLNFVSVCRLVHQKAIYRLIKVHSKLIKAGFKHRFFIVGDGPQRKKLENLIEVENVKDTFILLGKKENPYPYIKKADFFCLLSYFEGYPMVLEEAKILSKNILITNTSARESLDNYSKGRIFENTEEGIYKGLKEIFTGAGIMQTKQDYKKESYDNKHILEEIVNIIEK